MDKITIPLVVCEMNAHQLESYNAEIVGDGSLDVAINERCGNCGCNVQLYYTPTGFIYTLRLEGYDNMGKYDDESIIYQESIMFATPTEIINPSMVEYVESDHV